AMPANGAETSPRPAAASWAGCQTQGNFETCHTDPPGSGGEDTTIVDRLGQLVRSTNAGDTIRIAMFTWSRKRLATDVIEAKKRGVDVRVVFDQKGGGAEPAEMMKAEGVPVTVCVNSCLGDKINHNKFFLFDIGGQRSVV